MAHWGKLSREDLRAFDDDQTKAVLYAMDHGGVGRISSSGHAIIRNETGETMSVSRSSAGRRRLNVARDLVRLFGAEEEPQASAVVQGAFEREPVRATSSVSVAAGGGGGTQTLEQPTIACPAKGCTATFVTEGARYVHVNEQHHKCPEDGCDFVGRVAQSLILHKVRKHTDIDPNDPKYRKKRAAQAVQSEAEGSEQVPYDQGGLPKPVEVATSPTLEANNKLLMIRELLGEDPRVAQLEQQVQDLLRERDDLKAQLSLVREALGLS